MKRHAMLITVVLALIPALSAILATNA